jgi:hypothetical protein
LVGAKAVFPKIHQQHGKDSSVAYRFRCDSNGGVVATICVFRVSHISLLANSLFLFPYQILSVILKTNIFATKPTSWHRIYCSIRVSTSYILPRSLLTALFEQFIVVVTHLEY